MRKLFLMALPLILLWGALAAGEIYKNTASQKIALFAQDMATGLPKTGDAANLTAYISKDHGAVAALTDTSAAELDADYAKGWYVFDLAQAETNAEVLLITAISTTSDVNVAGAYVVTRAYTVDANGMLEGVVMDVSKSAEVADTEDMETALETVLDDRDVTEARMAYLLMIPNVAAELASETYGLSAIQTRIGAPAGASTIAGMLTLLQTDADSIDAIAAKLDTMLVASGDNFQFTTDAIENAPAATVDDWSGWFDAIGMTEEEYQDWMMQVSPTY